MRTASPCNRTRRRSPDRGAALVEFAFLSVPLLILLFGVVESSWAFYLLTDVRHATHEGARLTALGSDPTPTHGSPATLGERLAQETCERMDRRAGAGVRIDLVDSDGNGTFDVGDELTIEVSKQFDQLTNFLGAIFGDMTLDESVTARIERTPEGTVDGTDWSCA